MRARSIPVYLGVPLQTAPRAEWVLRTLLAVCGAAPVPVYEPERAAECVLAYAPQPVAGVPTIPVSEAALDLLTSGDALPPDSFDRFETPAGPLEGVFPVDGEGFAAPFDLIAAAFLLLACWDEHTSPERDQHGRLPFTASVFARNDALDYRAPAVDGYLRLVRILVNEGLEAADRGALQRLDWAAPYTRDGGEGGGAAAFAVALTHDVDGLKRWTARGWLAAAKRTVGAARTGNWEKAHFELGGVGYALTRDIPRGRDPFWTFPELLAQEDERGVSSTFFLLASHGHPTDGSQPAVYRKRLPRLVALLRDADREIGLHGNDRDRIEEGGLAEDRAALAEKAQVEIAGMRYHYLRCLYHETLPLLDTQGFAYDTSLAFAEREGFRCGFSFPFHPYDLRRERPLDLVELPLAIMDSSLQEKKYRGLDAPQAREAAQAVLATLRESGGAAALLWHHNRFHAHVGRGYGDVYWQLLDWIEEQGGVALPAGELVRRYRERAGETTL